MRFLVRHVGRSSLVRQLLVQSPVGLKGGGCQETFETGYLREKVMTVNNEALQSFECHAALVVSTEG